MSPDSKEQILRAEQLQLVAVDVFSNLELAKAWLEKTHALLVGLTPNDYAKSVIGEQKVRGMLAALKYGGVA